MDTHEHLSPWEKDRPKGDVLEEYLRHYFSCDLVSAGLSEADLATVRDSSKALADRWRLVEPHWKAARNTGYGRALEISARDLYGLVRIDRDTIEALDKAFQAARAGGKAYRTVLKEKSKIAMSILDSGMRDCDREFFAPTARLDDFIRVPNPQAMATLAKYAGAAHPHAERPGGRLRGDAGQGFRRGAVCIKSGLAYCRPLAYPKVSRAAAEDAFAASSTRRARTSGRRPAATPCRTT